MSNQSANHYLELRGIKDTSPEQLNEAMRRVLETMEPMIYEEPATGLTDAEQTVLKEGGLRLTRTSGRDLIAENAAKFAAIVERSVNTEAVAELVGMTSSRMRQLIASRELYSFRLDKKRMVPLFQIRDKRLVPNIVEVNQVLPGSMHPVAVYNWYHFENVELFTDDKQDNCLSPIEWLAEGRDPSKLVFMAQHL